MTIMTPLGTRRVAAALLALAATTVPARAAGVAEAARPIVAEHCAACHLVPDINQGVRVPMPGAPAFQDIADNPTTYTPERLTTFLQKPHFPMKQITLSSGDIENLLAYFAGLRGQTR